MSPPRTPFPTFPGPPEEPVPEACARCRFWERMSLDQGGCRRYPPVVHTNADGTMNSTYPQTQGGDWCGEFAPPAARPVLTLAGAQPDQEA